MQIIAIKRLTINHKNGSMDKASYIKRVLMLKQQA